MKTLMIVLVFCAILLFAFLAWGAWREFQKSRRSADWEREIERRKREKEIG